MDIKQFVDESLTQILQGITAAQKRNGGQHIAAEAYISPGGNLINGGTSGIFTIVDFDISVVTTATDRGDSIRVSSIEMTGGPEKQAQSASRVKFSIHVRLPEGGRAPTDPSSTSAISEYDPFDDGVHS
ncbi:MAG: hypothetical protein WB677_17990 [Xanthobacteraceae bacterium]